MTFITITNTWMRLNMDSQSDFIYTFVSKNVKKKSYKVE